ncbi:MAG TPA: hypothetical protein VMW38_25050 [Terriglobia bacterium]|nr:hypothetical protein [Terriglobia bacterium]
MTFEDFWKQHYHCEYDHGTPYHKVVFLAWHARDDEIAELIQRAVVKIGIGSGALTKDLVWCECGRGISLQGRWVFCPNCGGKIDQGSYAEAIKAAVKNGAKEYIDADIANNLADLHEQLEIVKNDKDNLEVEVKDMRERAEKAEAACMEILSVAESHSCGIIHQSYADGATCLDVIEHAKKFPDEYIEEYKLKVLRGENCCFRCKLLFGAGKCNPGSALLAELTRLREKDKSLMEAVSKLGGTAQQRIQEALAAYQK